MSNLSWIEELKVGDKVLVGEQTRTVKAIQKLHIILDNGLKYNKSGRDIKSSRYYRSCFKQATPEAIAELNRHRKRSELLHIIHRADWNNFEIDDLEKVVEIIVDRIETLREA